MFLYEVKKCTKCNKFKPIKEFRKKNANRIGKNPDAPKVHASCKKCEKIKLSQRIERSKIPIICDNCGREFSKSIYFIKSNLKQGRKLFMCSQECQWSSMRKTENRIYKCKNCGLERKVKNRISPQILKDWLCMNCRDPRSRPGGSSWMKINLLYLTCHKCGEIFIKSASTYTAYCNSCFGSYGTQTPSKVCKMCGVELNGTTRTHKKSSATCDVCNYIVRKNYKDKAKYGIDDWEYLTKLNLINAISGIKHRRGGFFVCEKMPIELKLHILKNRASQLGLEV
jgi:hypothetical protein